MNFWRFLACGIAILCGPEVIASDSPALASQSDETLDIGLVAAQEANSDGHSSSIETFFRLPDHIRLREGSAIELKGQAAKKFILDHPSVWLNDMRLETTSLQEARKEPEQAADSIEIPVPHGVLKLGWNRLVVQGPVSSETADGGSILGKEALLHVAYRRVSLFPELQRFPETIAEERLLQSDHAKPEPSVGILLPPNLRKAHFRAIGIVAARLGQCMYLASEDCRIGRLDEFSNESTLRNGILVGTRAELAKLDLPSDFALQMQKLKEGTGFVAEWIIPVTRSGSNQRRWIIVTGADDVGLEKAALATGSAHALETAPIYPMTIETTPILPDWVEKRALPSPADTSFSALGVENILFRGEQSKKTLAWRLPPGFEIVEGSRLRLRLNRSENLGKSSQLKIFLNGMALGNLALMRNSSDQMEMALPSGFQGSDPMFLSFQSNLKARQQQSSEPLWVELLGTSTLEVRTKRWEVLSLNRLSHLLLQDFFGRRAAILIPQALNADELNFFFKLMMKFGHELPSSPVLWPEVCCYGPAEKPSAARLEGRAVLLLGSLLQWKQALPADCRLPIEAADATGDFVSMRGQKVAVQAFEPTLVFAQMIASPWSKSQKLVVVGGWKDFAHLGAEKFFDSNFCRSLAHEVGAMDASERFFSYDLQNLHQDSLANTLQRSIPKGVSRAMTRQLIVWLKTQEARISMQNKILTAVAFLLFIGGVAVQTMLLRARHRRRREKGGIPR